VNVIEHSWTAVHAGRTTAVVGGLIPPALPADWLELRVECSTTTRACGAIRTARALLSELVDSTMMERAKARIGLSLRRRVFGDVEKPEDVETFVELLNRAAAAVDRPIALVFDDVKSADEDSLELLSELIGYPGRFNAAIVLQYHAMPRPDGPGGDVLARVRIVEGPEGLIGTETGPETWAELNPVASRTQTLF